MNFARHKLTSGEVSCPIEYLPSGHPVIDTSKDTYVTVEMLRRGGWNLEDFKWSEAHSKNVGGIASHRCRSDQHDEQIA